MRIKGDKASGYFVTYDRDGRKREGETRQCQHCQFTWEYIPGSGKRRGFCTNCQGLLCGKMACMKMVCAPFRDALESDDYIMTTAGTMVKKKQFIEEEKKLNWLLKKFGNVPIIGGLK